ncbi:Fpg/Nei family DNA glycosylase [Arthrobacter cryoconiti]|uniref:DNA-(apurinic or apyrimidinic site) lyase n=1 Tax=Arthrobacter cryoconiti TaxID=748907 RepID=A0ABV8QZR8_9MICC|nr:DNA glycosylase [Arthrobacter cryoconiti]MCC9068550.1 Fpg/Nei family DNA glycosylase [Arthrobacter cryoconiti]
MPEGHSVHRLARQFNDVFGATTLLVSSPQGKFSAGAALLDGHRLERAQAHGKQMFLYFSQDRIMRVHLGLYGAWDFGGDSTFTGASSIGAPRRVGEREVSAGLAGDGGDGGSDYNGPPEPKGAVRVRLVSDHGWADLRGPTACEVLTPVEVSAVLAKLGPDPLNDPFKDEHGDEDEFVRRIRSSASNIAVLLMKQEIIAGVGNVYRAEVLFRLGIDPRMSGKSLQEEEIRSLWREIRALMKDGVRDGRIITTELIDRPSGTGVAPHSASNPVPRKYDAGAQGAASNLAYQPTGDGLNGDGLNRGGLQPNKEVPREDAHYVYKRNGLPCRHCETAVAMAELAARKLYWCPQCQGSPQP